MPMFITCYYEENYYKWQRSISEFGGKLNLFKFKEYINEFDTVADFGCGGGYLLYNIKCRRKIGVEINDVARIQANKLGVEVFKYPSELENEICDVIISNHALEHVNNPFEIIKILHNKLKPNGKIIFVVPNEKKRKYNPNDINQHLYTWSEMNLGNLFNSAGYNVIEVKEIYHKWPPKYILIRKLSGEIIFHMVCRIYGYIRRNISQIRIVAIKPKEL